MVSTEMTRGQGEDVEVVVEDLIKRIDETDMEKSGVFLHRSGEVLPW
jgi:hypothetical protein